MPSVDNENSSSSTIFAKTSLKYREVSSTPIYRPYSIRETSKTVSLGLSASSRGFTSSVPRVDDYWNTNSTEKTRLSRHPMWPYGPSIRHLISRRTNEFIGPTPPLFPLLMSKYHLDQNRSETDFSQYATQSSSEMFSRNVRADLPVSASQSQALFDHFTVTGMQSLEQQPSSYRLENPQLEEHQPLTDYAASFPKTAKTGVEFTACSRPNQPPRPTRYAILEL